MRRLIRWGSGDQEVSRKRKKMESGKKRDSGEESGRKRGKEKEVERGRGEVWRQRREYREGRRESVVK